MRERIAQMLPDNRSRHIRMGTFHSVFSRILRENAERIGFPESFTIYDSSDSRNLVKTVVRELNLPDEKYKPNARGFAHILCQKLSGDPRRLPRQFGLCGRGPAGADSRVRQHLQHLLPALQTQRGDGLRRPAAANQRAAARLSGRAGALPGAVQIHSGGRVPGHQLCAVRHHPPSVADPFESLRRGRRRAVDLLVPRGQDREHPLFPEGLPLGEGLQARTELPLDAHDRRCGQLGDRPQLEAHGEALLLGRGRGGDRSAS